MSALPELTYGNRFAIKSLRGSQYQVTVLGVGESQSGIYVRLVDGRVARLDIDRLQWDTFQSLPEDPATGLRVDDEVLLESSSGTMRGTLTEDPHSQLKIRLPIGSVVEIPISEIEELHLLFRARDLKPGDRVMLKSKSGNEYRGLLKAFGQRGRRLLVRLDMGGDVNLRLSKVDLTSLVVPIKIPVHSLATNGA